MSIVKGSEAIKKPLSESALNKKSLCDYVINVATGCTFGCTFCLVPSTPMVRMKTAKLAAIGIDNPLLDWGNYLLVRDDLPEALERQLSHMTTWRETPSGRGVVLLCIGTDPYQNAQTAKITREAIQCLLRYGKRVRLLTRSPLWIQDLDLLVNPLVTVGMSIPHGDDQLSRQMEPHAPLPSDRLRAMQTGFEAGCRMFVAMAPTPPTMTASEMEAHLVTLLSCHPEVIFWEPINRRGTNLERMTAAGITWVDQIKDRKAWAEYFLQQWAELERLRWKLQLGDRLHIWTDAGLQGLTDQAAIERWWYRPTVEVWQPLPHPVPKSGSRVVFGTTLQ